MVRVSTCIDTKMSFTHEHKASKAMQVIIGIGHWYSKKDQSGLLHRLVESKHTGLRGTLLFSEVHNPTPGGKVPALFIVSKLFHSLECVGCRDGWTQLPLGSSSRTFDRTNRRRLLDVGQNDFVVDRKSHHLCAFRSIFNQHIRRFKIL